MNLSNHQQRQLQQQAAQILRQVAPWLDPLGRRVLTALLMRTAQGWHLFIRRDPAPADTAVAYLVGPGGVFTVVVGERPPDERAALIIAREAEERCAGMRGPRDQVLANSAVRHVVVLPGTGKRMSSPLYQVLTERDLDSLYRTDGVLLNRRQAESVANQLAIRLKEYQRVGVGTAQRAPEGDGMLNAEELTADQVAAAQERPFETWMTFLHPHQHAIATRDYAGPARISGPAGTGKTVVALHRLRHLARHTTGPLLFTTFVRTLPVVHRESFRRLAPELADRIQFVHLHAWARSFLTDRGLPATVHSTQVNTAFSHAWMAHRTSLQELAPATGYWQDEIDRVIKGRGLATLQDYTAISRRGRSVPLNGSQRALVWQLYETYERNLAEKHLMDHNDLISSALRELIARPLDEPYAAVVVDEVQDITLTGLRLLHQLSGDGPNRLLLVGDGQQQVYPGGWRLSEAHIPVRGRGEVLRVNYRNRANILGFAQRFQATNNVDDLDGAEGVALRDVECANPGGETRRWRGPEADLPNALVDAVKTLPVPKDHAALIIFDHRSLKRCTEILNRAGIPLQRLDQYTGEPVGALKIGTVHRAKGLDFQAVLTVLFPPEDARTEAAEHENREQRVRQHLVAATRARDYLWWAEIEPPHEAGKEPSSTT